MGVVVVVVGVGILMISLKFVERLQDTEAASIGTKTNYVGTGVV